MQGTNKIRIKILFFRNYVFNYKTDRFLTGQALFWQNNYRYDIINLMKIPQRTKIGIIIILLIVFFIILNLTGFSKDVKNFFYLVSAPIQKTFWEAGNRVSDFFETVSEIRNLKKENENLEFRIQELSAEIARLRDLEKENKVLREALDIDLQEEFKIVFAQITGKDIVQDSILINIGSKDGILKDMPVISPQKVLLGRISQIYDNFSRVMLVSNKESIFSVNIQGEAVDDTIEAVAKGKGNFQVKVDRIPLKAEIKRGDKVVTSALGGLFPSGILIGYIKNIERLGVELFQQAEIQPMIDIRELRYIFVITDF